MSITVTTKALDMLAVLGNERRRREKSCASCARLALFEEDGHFAVMREEERQALIELDRRIEELELAVPVA